MYQPVHILIVGEHSAGYILTWHLDRRTFSSEMEKWTVLGVTPVNRFGSVELAMHDFEWEDDREHATIRQQDLQTKHLFSFNQD